MIRIVRAHPLRVDAAAKRTLKRTDNFWDRCHDPRLIGLSRENQICPVTASLHKSTESKRELNLGDVEQRVKAAFFGI